MLFRERLGGRVEIDSWRNKGTVMRFVFPPSALRRLRERPAKAA